MLSLCCVQGSIILLSPNKWTIISITLHLVFLVIGHILTIHLKKKNLSKIEKLSKKNFTAFSISNKKISKIVY